MRHIIEVTRKPLVAGLFFCAMATFAASDEQPRPTRQFPLPLPSPATHTKLAAMWNLDELFRPPTTYPLTDYDATGTNADAVDVKLAELKTPEGVVAPLFFDGVPFQGKPTRVFAWVGEPAKPATTANSGKVPGIVLVHGGGGTAFRDWVWTWVKRGYAAVAMDTGGNIPLTPGGVTPKLRRHEWAGPSDASSFTKALDPVGDQWPFHAVAAVIRAHSLLRSLPGVDPERTGITGISWGGVWTEVVVGLDSRFKFSAPVYGCGFRGENSPALDDAFQRLPPDHVTRWLELWDPSQYLPFAKMPVLFVNGTNDHHFRPNVWRKTTRLPGGPVTRSLKVRMPHGHPPAGDPREVAVFADALVRDGTPLVKIAARGRDAAHVWVTWDAAQPTVSVLKAELVYTTGIGHWPARQWEIAPARIVGKNHAETDIPAGATAFYFNLHDTRGCIVSCEHWENTEK
ncbi:dipeptidyl aminopeptidase [Opitutaceae bacterium TAV4]|nr:dipeptidyl aminopeptidase [Opitutaceae bacterium TAV4]RRK00619.1 dipeptidyl aminopeptidase [Opitutaceae bacterium TAV3]